MIPVLVQSPKLILMPVAFLLFGGVVGVVYFGSLAWNVHVLLARRRMGAAAFLPVVRGVVASSGLGFASIYGIGTLVACVAGFMVTRSIALRITGAPP